LAVYGPQELAAHGWKRKTGRYGKQPAETALFAVFQRQLCEPKAHRIFEAAYTTGEQAI
jgi:hypothetical protein